MSEQVASESISQRHLVVRAALRSDVGLVRSENQDFGTYTTSEEEIDSHTGGRLLIVADGMGGHRGGATASRLAAETVKAQFLGSETNDIPTALRDSLVRANARIFAEAQANPELRGMGTTTSVLAIRGRQGWFAHVGDSRIYLVRDGGIRQLTEDHSLVATMVREGLLTSAEAETHPRRNVLQRSMGVAEDVEVDLSGPFDLQPGDTFILCSDGLHGLVKEPELREIAAKPIEVAADEYLRKALERGAPDNVTVIVARVEERTAATSAGDETLVEHPPLDETQPLDVLDETQRDTAKMPVVTDEQVAQAAKTLEMPPPAAAQPLMSPAPEADAAAAAPVMDAPAIVEPPPFAEPATVIEPLVPPAIAAPQPKAAEPEAAQPKAPEPKAPHPQATEPMTAPARTMEIADPSRQAARPAERRPVAAPDSRRPLIVWTLVLALLAGGAAGVWYYWTHHNAIAKESSSPTSR